MPFGQSSGLAQAEPGALLETEHFIFKALPDAPSDLVPDPEQIQEIGLFYESVIKDLEEGFGGQVRDKITVVYGGTAAMAQAIGRSYNHIPARNLHLPLAVTRCFTSL